MDKYFVYLIKSKSEPEQKYIGITKNIDQRLNDHNKGYSKHTSKFKPWELIAYFVFFDKQKAYDFEKYLKSHSGRAFSNKRFW